MGDDRRRRAERRAREGDTEDKAQLLLQRMRSGEVTGLQVEVAAALGEPAAVKLLDHAAPKLIGHPSGRSTLAGFTSRWRDFEDSRLHAALTFVGPWVAIAWAADLIDRVQNKASYSAEVNGVCLRVKAAARTLAIEGYLPARLTERLASTSSAMTDLQREGSEARAIVDAAAALAVGLDWFPAEDGDLISRTRRVATQASATANALGSAAWRAAVGATRSDVALARASSAKETQARAAFALLGARVLEETRDGDGGAEWVYIRDTEPKIASEFNRASGRANPPGRGDDELRRLERDGGARGEVHQARMRRGLPLVPDKVTPARTTKSGRKLGPGELFEFANGFEARVNSALLADLSQEELTPRPCRSSWAGRWRRERR